MSNYGNEIELITEECSTCGEHFDTLSELDAHAVDHGSPLPVDLPLTVREIAHVNVTIRERHSAASLAVLTAAESRALFRAVAAEAFA